MIVVDSAALVDALTAVAGSDELRAHLARQELPMTAANVVSRGGFLQRVRTSAYVLFQMLSGSAAGY